MSLSQVYWREVRSLNVAVSRSNQRIKETQP